MKIYVFDIDGTICSQEKPEDYSEAKPIWSRIHQINKLYKKGNVIYFETSRHMIHESITKKWLKKYGVKYHHVFFGKPVADVYVDEKGVSAKEFFDRKARTSF